jgi:riboflavin kinase/FMN adenylyltransferase
METKQPNVQYDKLTSQRPKKRIIALGFFDGIHLGHTALFNKACEIGNKSGLIPSATTFDSHPLAILRNKEIPLINSSEDRAWLIRNMTGIDDKLILHFDKETSQVTWEKFIEHLVDEFGAKHFIAGEDYRFGKAGEGNSELLKQKCAQMGLGCDIFPHVEYDGVKVSSTTIRKLLLSGDIKQANTLLGHPHILSDVVRYGFRLGSKLGTPTINMMFQEGVLIPARGVYATKVYIEDSDTSRPPASPRIGVTNIGARPTVADSGKITAETHILNFRENLYGRKVRLEFHKFMRPEIKFNSLEELKAQIKKDCEAASEYFNLD